MAAPIFTIGHSTRPFEAFAALLRENEIGAVADVRSIPRSRRNPQYNRETLPELLEAQDVRYVHLPELGGRRGKQELSGPSPNTFWEHAAFRNYADYALTPPFRHGLERLRTLAHGTRGAIMCAEAVWWRCHRRIIADYLLASGEAVFHILGAGHVEKANLTPEARIVLDLGLIYEADQAGLGV